MNSFNKPLIGMINKYLGPKVAALITGASVLGAQFTEFYTSITASLPFSPGITELVKQFALDNSLVSLLPAPLVALVTYYFRRTPHHDKINDIINKEEATRKFEEEFARDILANRRGQPEMNVDVAKGADRAFTYEGNMKDDLDALRQREDQYVDAGLEPEYEETFHDIPDPNTSTEDRHYDYVAGEPIRTNPPMDAAEGKARVAEKLHGENRQYPDHDHTEFVNKAEDAFYEPLPDEPFNEDFEQSPIHVDDFKETAASDAMYEDHERSQLDVNEIDPNYDRNMAILARKERDDLTKELSRLFNHNKDLKEALKLYDDRMVEGAIERAELREEIESLKDPNRDPILHDSDFDAEMVVRARMQRDEALEENQHLRHVLDEKDIRAEKERDELRLKVMELEDKLQEQSEDPPVVQPGPAHKDIVEMQDTILKQIEGDYILPLEERLASINENFDAYVETIDKKFNLIGENERTEILKDAPGVIKPHDFWPNDTQPELEKYFGKMGQSQTMLQLPYTMQLAWDKDTKIQRFSCHEKVAEALNSIFNRTLDHYGVDGIRELGLDQFGGCLNVRLMRGSDGRYSTHSWGISVDLDPDRNGLRVRGDDARLGKDDAISFWQIVESTGMQSSGRVRGFDYMHFQAAEFIR